MKLIKLLVVAACAFALVTGSSMAEDKKGAEKLKGKIVAGSCCDKAKKADKDCSHPCCVESVKDGKVCGKCNKLKGKIVADSCCDKAVKADKDCTHPCCVEAVKEGKVCGKCNKQDA